MSEKTELIPVLVTAGSSIYFGFALKSRPTKSGRIRLFRARHVYSYGGGEGTWSLASAGPSSDSRVGPEVPELLVTEVLRVGVCTQRAVDTFAAQGWGRRRA